MAANVKKVITLDEARLLHSAEPHWLEKGGQSKDEGVFRDLISKEACGSTDLMMGVYYMQPGEIHPLHYHPNGTEFYYVLSGSAQITVDDKVVDARPGTAIYMPPGTNHKIVVTGNEQMSLIYGFNVPDFADAGCVWLE